MKKKLLALIMAGLMACSFTGCGEKGLSNEYITITQYEKLEVPKASQTEVTDEIVNYYIESKLGEEAVRTEVKDRAVANGDIVNINYKGTVDGVEFQGGAADNSELTIGSNRFIGPTDDYKGFEEQIIGHKQGDNFDIKVQFPDPYMSEDLAGKVATFNINVNAVYEEDKPELNDEFVQTVSDKSKTVEEYKEEVKAIIEENDKLQVESQLAYDILGVLVSKVEVKKFPEGSVEEKIAEADEYYKGMAAQSGLEFADFTQQFLGLDEAAYNSSLKEMAEEQVKLELACKLIAEEKGLEPTKEEYDEKIAQFAAESGIGTPSEFLEVVGEDTVKLAILQDEVGKYLVETCVPVESK